MAFLAQQSNHLILVLIVCYVPPQRKFLNMVLIFLMALRLDTPPPPPKLLQSTIANMQGQSW
jgi:hypothetical protein